MKPHFLWTCVLFPQQGSGDVCIAQTHSIMTLEGILCLETVLAYSWGSQSAKAIPRRVGNKQMYIHTHIHGQECRIR